MRVTLIFTTHFRAMLGIDRSELSLQEGAVVADAIATFLAGNPHHRSVLEERKGFLFGKLKAIYSIDGRAVKPDHELSDGDQVKVLKAFIGG